MKIRIALFFGGCSPEYAVSLRSAAAVLRHLRRERYDITCIGITKNGHFALTEAAPEAIEQDTWQTGSLPVLLSHDREAPGLLIFSKDGGITRRQVDLILPVLHGGMGENGVIQGLFALSGIAFVGCDTEASAICMDKAVTRTLMADEGLPLLPWVALTADDKSDLSAAVAAVEEKIGYPAFVKPAGGGSSLGAGRADDRAQLILRLGEAAMFDSRILVEQYIRAREVELAVCVRGGEVEISSPGEIQPAEDDFYSYRAKYEDASAMLRDEATVSSETRERLRDYAARAFARLGLRGLARIDFFVTDSEQIFFNEVNTLPGFTDISMFPRLLTRERSFSDLLDLLIDEALDDDRRF